MEDKYSTLINKSAPIYSTMTPGRPLGASNLELFKRLWDQSAKGDLYAYKTLHEYFYPGLYNYAFVLLNGEILCNQIIENLFVQIWQSSTKEYIPHIRIYFYKVLRSSILDLKKSNNYDLHYNGKINGLDRESDPILLNKLEMAYFKYFECWEDAEISDLIGYPLDYGGLV